MGDSGVGGLLDLRSFPTLMIVRLPDTVVGKDLPPQPWKHATRLTTERTQEMNWTEHRACSARWALPLSRCYSEIQGNMRMTQYCYYVTVIPRFAN